MNSFIHYIARYIKQDVNYTKTDLTKIKNIGTLMERLVFGGEIKYAHIWIPYYEYIIDLVEAVENESPIPKFSDYCDNVSIYESLSTSTSFKLMGRRHIVE